MQHILPPHKALFRGSMKRLEVLSSINAETTSAGQTRPDNTEHGIIIHLQRLIPHAGY
jgi:hypothetical protein